MELKIKIKETVEERRKLTIEERLLLQCRNNNYDVDMHFKKIGLVDVVHNISNEDFIGVFQKETVRDATTDEILAWVVVILNEQNPEYEHSLTLHSMIAGLFQCTNKYTWIKADKILEDKEIIPELI
jgi:hypothetical protein